MRKLLAVITVLASLAPAAAMAKSPSDLRLIMEEGRPGRRFLRSTARAPITAVISKPTIQNVPLDAGFHSSEYGIRVSYPKSWELQSTPESTPPLTLVAAFLSPVGLSSVRQNVNLVIEDLPTTMTLEEYTAKGLEIEKNMLNSFSLTSSENISFFGRERAQRVMFTAASGTQKLMFSQIWFLKGKRAYIWTFADKSDSFYKNLSTFERMMDSFLID